MESRIHVSFHLAPPEVVDSPTPPVDTTASVQQTKRATATAVTQTTTSTTLAPKTTATDDDVEDVRVMGPLPSRSPGPASFDITLEKLGTAIPRTNASDALKLAPGFLLTNEGGSGHAEQVFLRGFDAHEGQDLEFTRRRRPHQRRGQLPRQRLRRHALHHPRAHSLGPRARGAVRAAAGRLRRRRQRRLPARARPPRAHHRVHVRQLQHAAAAAPVGPERRAHRHVRRRRVLHDRRLRHEPPGQARHGHRAVRDPRRREGRPPPQRHGVRHRVQLGRRRPRGRLRSPGASASTARRTRTRSATPRRALSIVGDLREPLQRHRRLAAALRHRPDRCACSKNWTGFLARRPGAHADAARPARRP